MRRRRLLAAALCLLVAGCGGSAGRRRPALPPAHPLVLGFADNSVAQRLATPAADAALLARAGARIARVQLDWRTAEPAPGDYRLGAYDQIYRDDLRHGVRVLFILAYAPPWAAAHACAGPCLVAPAPEHDRDAAHLAALIARRYPKLAGIEIWNEPNTTYFWGGAPDPARYAALLRSCHDAVKAVRPKLPVLGGSIANSPDGGGRMSLPVFLSAILANGAAHAMDALSIHPYPSAGDLTGDSVLTTVAVARQRLRSVGAGALPIWVTEVGYSTSGPDAVSPGAQAGGLTRVVQLLHRAPGVTTVLVHTLVEPPYGRASQEPGFGVVRADGRTKPAFCALARLMRGPGGCPAQVSLRSPSRSP
jgi:hypothetical protein